MVLRLALLMLALNSGLAEASNRSTRIAMAVALLDVAEEHCGSSIEVDPEMRRTSSCIFTSTTSQASRR